MPFGLGIQVSNSTIVEFNAERYVIAPGISTRLPSPVDGALLNIVAYIYTNSLNAASSISLAINGVAVVTLPIPEGTDGLLVFPAYYPIPAGTLVSFLCNALAASAGGITFHASSLFVPQLPG